MRNDKRVETTLMQELKPRHIELGGGGASPLASLEEDETDWEPRLALLFKARHENALRVAKSEEDIFTRILVVYPNEGSSPEWEIVAVAQTD